MKYKSVFEIIGPVMIGPSSSHTAGAVQIGRIAGKVFGEVPDQIRVHFYGSFAETYKGHATDVAVVGGILGLDADDEKVRESLQIAGQQGISVSFYQEEAVPEHPNTMTIRLRRSKRESAITGISIGGGAIQISEIDGFPLRLSGENPALLIFHQDIQGMVASVAAILSEYQMNISHMEVSRKEKGKTALMVIETDQRFKQDQVNDIKQINGIDKVIILEV